MTTFVIVHGAWAGAWAWVRVGDRLTAQGHRVVVPTLSGLGERSHLAGPQIGFETHVADIVNEIRWKDLQDVVLVAHSYGGFVATAAVEEVGDRLAAIVYVDAFIPKDGQAFADFSPDWQVPADRLIDAPPAVLGDYLDDADRIWVNAKATPQPAGTFTGRVRVTGAYERVPRKAFVQATGWDGAIGGSLSEFEGRADWSVHRIACGHDVAIDKPDDLVAILETFDGSV
ncbi:MAG: alpha/beta fold hydrolase [Rhizobiaceae bacterium]